MNENIKICNACLTVIPEGSEHRHIVSNIDMVQEFTPLTTLEKVEKQRADLLEAAQAILDHWKNEYGPFGPEEYQFEFKQIKEAISRATEGE